MSHGSLEELREKILEEAREKARKIIEDAEKKAKEIIGKAEEEWRRKLEEEKNNIINEARKQASAILSEAKIKYNLVILKAKNEVLEEVFEKAKDVLKQRNFDVEKSLERLLSESIQYLPENTTEITIIVNPRDESIIKKVATSILKDKVKYKIVKDDKIIGGIVIETPKGIRIDNTYEARLSRVKEGFINKISEILWKK